MYMKIGGFSGKDVMQQRGVMQRRFRRQAGQDGATLLEVLVSIVVFSLGMIGMLGLVISSLQMTSTSNYRSIAAEQLAAIADTLNANPTMLNDYVAAATASGGAVGTCFTETGCTNAQLAATEYRLWRDRAGALLPSGTARLYRSDDVGTWNSNGRGRLVASVCWDESRVLSIDGWRNPCLIVQL